MAACLPLLVAAAPFGGAPHPAAGHPLATLLAAFGTRSSGTLNPLLLHPGYQLDFPPSPPAALSAHFFGIFQSTAGSSYDMAQVHIVFG